MKSGATESSFHYLSQHYTFPENVDVQRTTHEIIKSDKKYKIIWAHDNCDQMGHKDLPQHVDKVDGIVCVSNWEREQFIKYNRAPAEKLHVIPNGVHEMFRPSGKPKSKTCIFFSAPHKGVAPLVPIWKEVIKHHPDAKLKVFSSMSLYGDIQPGEGDNETVTGPNGLEPSPFISVYKELKELPGVEYSPCIDREELLSHIQDAAFYIHPNVWEETFCVSLAEAMSCGCFPITTGMGALPETSNWMGKYIPMSGQNTLRGWIPDETFHKNFAEEVIRALSAFDKVRDEYNDISKKISMYATKNYNWKIISNKWKYYIDVITKKIPIFIFERMTMDEIIFNNVYIKNDYQIKNLKSTDVVIDIGAHRGSFSKLCLDLGCKNVVSFEPEKENYNLLQKNLESYSGVRTFNMAVYGHNANEVDLYSYPTKWNTGMNTLYNIKQEGYKNYSIQKVRCISLDDILNQLERVRLIKIDTEGSEFEIIMNSKLLHKVNEIVGEFHNNVTSKFNINNLVSFLKNKNFTIDLEWENDCSGLFFAKNNNLNKSS